MCMTRMTTFDAGRDDHGDADAHVPGRSATWSPTSRSTTRRRARSRRSPRPPTSSPASTGWRRSTSSAPRSSASASSASCARTSATSIRDHEENKPTFAGPRFFIRIAELDMHPLDTARPRASAQDEHGLGLLQHHQVLHRGLPRAHQDHRQRDHPDEGARRRPQVRPAAHHGEPHPEPPPRRRRRLTPVRLRA